jgi:hypothetical protein
MQEGAFALIDCLGFKGIWRRTDPTLLLRKLSNIEQVVSDRVLKQEAFKFLSFGTVRPHVRLLSDTVAISLHYEAKDDQEPEGWQKNFLVGSICYSVIEVLSLFLQGDPPLVLRGCISYGEHLSEGNFMVGPAVDEAAEHMNIAEGAFIWLLPSAAERYRALKERTSLLLNLAEPGVVASAAYSGPKRPLIPEETGHPFRSKAATDSGVKPATF